MKETMCIDIATVIGWSVLNSDGAMQSGALELATAAELEKQRREGKERTGDIRFERMYRFGEAAIDRGAEQFVLEDVGFMRGRYQGQLFPTLRAAIWALAILHPGLIVHCVSSVTLKHFATGNGTASKEEMAKALVRHSPDLYRMDGGQTVRKIDGTIADDNEVDAIWLAYYTLAVWRGEREFLSGYDRKKRKVENRRNKRAQRLLLAKARKIKAQAKRKALKQAIRSLGQCCGAYRVQRYRWAICSRCGSVRPIPRAPGPANSPKREGD
jgi:hypothetical protein